MFSLRHCHLILSANFGKFYFHGEPNGQSSNESRPDTAHPSSNTTFIDHNMPQLFITLLEGVVYVILCHLYRSWLEKFYLGVYIPNPDSIKQVTCDFPLCGILHRRSHYNSFPFSRYAVQVLHFAESCISKERNSSSHCFLHCAQHLKCACILISSLPLQNRWYP